MALRRACTPYLPRGATHLLRGVLKVETAPFRSYSSYFQTKSGLLVPSSIAPKASTFQRRCAWFTGSSVGCSAVSRVEPPARGGTGGRWFRTSPLGDWNPRSVTTGGISTPIGGLRLLSSQTVKDKAGKFEKLKIFARNEWENMDFRSKFTVFELIAKCVLLGFSGGWGLMLAYTVIHRVDKAEEVMKKMTEAIEKMEVELAASEERSDKHGADMDAKFEQLRLEVNELRSFKDLWVAYAFERETPGTAETK